MSWKKTKVIQIRVNEDEFRMIKECDHHYHRFSYYSNTSQFILNLIEKYY